MQSDSNIEASPGRPEQSPILVKASAILNKNKLEITKTWLSNLVERLDDLEALERFPTQETIRMSVELVEGLSHCLIDEKALEQFEEGGLYYSQAETLGLLQRDSSQAICSLADNLYALEDAIWGRLSEGLRQQDQDVIQLARVLHLGLHRMMTAATAAYHRQSSAELDRLAHTDSLTGLYNRRYWDLELARHVELYKRYRHPFAILMLDLDNLKWINDTFGHAAGDSALTHLAKIMRMNVRDVDITCRLGGDEFLILMPEADKNTVQMVGRRISDSINKTRFKLGHSFASLHVSFGVAACPEDGIDPEVLLREADASLYRSKQDKAGKGHPSVSSTP